MFSGGVKDSIDLKWFNYIAMWIFDSCKYFQFQVDPFKHREITVSILVTG